MTTFADVPSTHLLASSIAWVSSQDIMDGTSSTQFSPGSPVTRQVVAETLYRLAGRPHHQPPVVSPYPDVPASHPAYVAISWATSQGLTRTWPDKTFKPTGPLPREKAAEYLFRTADPVYTAQTVSPFADVATSRSNYREICWMYSIGLTSGSVRSGLRYFDPGSNSPRDHWAAFLHRFDQNI